MCGHGMAEPGRGTAKRLPIAVSVLMAEGFSLSAAICLRKRLTQAQVKSRIGTGQGYLSDLGKGRRAGAPEPPGAGDVPENFFTASHA